MISDNRPVQEVRKALAGPRQANNSDAAEDN